MKRTRLIFWLILMLIVALVLAACGDDDDDNGDTGDDDDAASAIELPQTFEGSDFGLTYTLNYPEGWIADATEGGVASSTEAMVAVAARPGTSEAEFPGDDEAGVLISVIPGEGLPADANAPADVMELAVGDLRQVEGVTLGDPEDVTVAGNSGARSSITTSAGAGELYIIQLESGNMLFVVTAAANFDTTGDTLRAIVDSISVTENAE